MLFEGLFHKRSAGDAPVELGERANNNLKINLLLQLTDKNVHSIAVVSAERGCGRTTLALQTALMFAKLGRRVALIEADLRNPQLADYMHSFPKGGLCDVVIGLKDLSDISYLHPEFYNMDCYYAGDTLISSTEIISTDRFKAIVQNINERYDICIYDTPAVLDSPDALRIAQLVDGIIFVVNPNTSRTAKVTQVRARFAEVNDNFIVFVMNQLNG